MKLKTRDDPGRLPVTKFSGRLARSRSPLSNAVAGEFGESRSALALAAAGARQ